MRKLLSRLIAGFLLLLVSASAVFGQTYCNGQPCGTDGTPTGITILSNQVASLVAAKPKILYVSNGSVTVGLNSSARSTMLPPPISGTSLLIPAGRLPVGASLFLQGRGLISARSLTPGTFNFYPHITPTGGTKTDLGGLSITPLIGVAAHCELWMTITQTPTGLQTSGIVKYGPNNSMAYSVVINPDNVIVASNPNVDRTFGADGQWMSADANNYVIPNAVTITLIPVS